MNKLFTNIVLIFTFLVGFNSCCTLSLNNVCTHGQATDLLDQDMKQDQDPNLTGDLPIE